jgi:hypothetical protein
VAGEDASLQLARGPFANEATRIEQGLQQTDHPVVVQLQAGDAPQSNQRGFGELRQMASVDWTGQQLGL